MEKLEEQLLIILQKALLVAEQSGEFVIEQAPLLLQEFYAWHLAKNIFIIVVLTIITILLYWAGKAIQKEFEEYWDSPAPAPHFFMLIPIVIVFDKLFNIVFILVAPKLYLIEYFLK